MKPYYQDDTCTIYHGDCREILPELPKVDMVLTDPPWGNDTATDSRRFTTKRCGWWQNQDREFVVAHQPIHGDTEEFDPRFLIEQKAILWGANHFTRHLPHSGGWLVWDKRLGIEQIADKGWPLGEAELAWTNIRGSTRVFRNLWAGVLRSEQQKEFYHPTQKPVGLMQWCLQLAGESCQAILDPFMGSGTTLRAAKDLGRKAIGIEIEEKYCEIAARRLAQEVLQFA